MNISEHFQEPDCLTDMASAMRVMEKTVSHLKSLGRAVTFSIVLFETGKASATVRQLVGSVDTGGFKAPREDILVHDQDSIPLAICKAAHLALVQEEVNTQSGAV